MFLHEENAEIKARHNGKLAINIGFLAVQLASIVVPMVARPKDFEFVKTSFILGLGISGIQILYNNQTKTLDGVKKVIDKAVLENLSGEINNAVTLNKHENRMQGLAALGYSVENFPDWMQDRLVHEFGLDGLTRPKAISKVTLKSVPPALTPYQPHDFTLMQAADPFEAYRIPQRFYIGSNVTFGIRGSGKTTIMALEMSESMRYVRHDKPSIVYCVDAHHDPSDDPWFPALTAEQEEKLFITDANQGYRAFVRFMEEARDRVAKKDQGGKKRGLLKFMCDEANGWLSRLDVTQAESVIEDIKFVMRECRKFGVEISLGLHDLTKGETGIDSRLLANFNLLILGMMVGDTTIAYPSDIDRKALTKGVSLMNSEIDSSYQRAAVLRMADIPAQVVVIDKVDRATIQFDLGNNPKQNEKQDSNVNRNNTDLVTIITQWYYSQSYKPSSEEVRAKWVELRKAPLDDRGLELLMEILEKKKPQ